MLSFLQSFVFTLIKKKMTEEIIAYICYSISSIFCMRTHLKYVTKTPGSSIYYNGKDLQDYSLILNLISREIMSELNLHPARVTACFVIKRNDC